MAHRNEDKPLEPEAANESLNSELYNATRKQSSVKTEDYPEAARGDHDLLGPDKKRD